MNSGAATRAALVTRISELEGRSTRIKTDLTEPMSADFEEQAVEIEDDESLLGQEALVLDEIAAVRAAILRLDEGRYGICQSCGADITPARLAAIPEAALCIGCASE
jgi:DnaK suppressor protein